MAAGSELTCGTDEQVVLSAHGRVLVVLATGSHVLSAQAIPALGAAGDGPNLALDVLFVSTGRSPMRFGAKLPMLRDAATSLTYEPRVFGTANLRVSDAHLFASQLQPGTSADDVLGYLQSRLVAAVGDAIAATRASITALASPVGAVMVGDVVVGANPFGSMGVAVVSFESFSVNVDEETLRTAMQLQKYAPAPAPVLAPPPVPVAPAHAPPRLPAPLPNEAPPEKVRCPLCAAMVPPGRFCMACGKPLSGKTHCTCGAALKPGAKFCAQCGARV
ncbi:MAG: SPFH domain-containing protein [Myxococcales bacterium]